MKLPLLLLALAAGALLPTSTPFAASPGARPVHLFILSGQSNMAALEPADAFLPQLRAELPDAEVLHLKVAMGGQPIRFWLAEWEQIAAAAGLEQPNEKGPIYYDRLLAEFRALRATHPHFDSITLCWMQGERDAKTGLAAAYERALLQLIANLRRDMRRPDLHVVIGRLSDHSPGAESQAGWDAIRALHVKIANGLPKGAWVDTDDLNNQQRDGRSFDGLHYTKDGYLEFGRRLARQSARLIRGDEPDPNGRPSS